MVDHPHIAIFDRKSDGPFFLNFLPIDEPVALYGVTADSFSEDELAKLDILAQKLLHTRPASGEPDAETVNAYIHRGPEDGLDYCIGNQFMGRSDWRRLDSLDEAIAVIDTWLDGYNRQQAAPSPPPGPLVP